MKEETDVYDIVIIGGGPAGLTAGQYASRATLKVVIIDKSRTAGALAYSSRIENYPGLTQPMPGKDLLDIMRKQAVDFGSEHIETQVVGVNLSSEFKEVVTMDRTYKGKTVVIATGSMGRKATIKGEAEFLGRGVSYCAICDAAFYKGLKVCIIGNSEEAVKEAGVLARFAETVYLISPTPKLHADDDHPVFKEPNVKVLAGFTVAAIEGNDQVERIRMIDPEKKQADLELSGVFVYLHGNKPVVDFLYGAVETNDDGCIPVNSMMETAIPGVFAAGDVTCTEVRQVVVAAAQGCLAALAAEKYLYKRTKYKMDWGK
ncbi:MAG TPA: FAD-dependent oxidoreductase [Thermodesulfovibrionales bacterium]|nr:FAD-dependent oxidoreductase [Thermodesulfovibrionales bacterium]